MGGSLGQGPATEITHLGLHQPPVITCMVHIHMYTCFGSDDRGKAIEIMVLSFHSTSVPHSIPSMFHRLPIIIALNNIIGVFYIG